MIIDSLIEGHRLVCHTSSESNTHEATLIIHSCTNARHEHLGAGVCGGLLSSRFGT